MSIATISPGQIGRGPKPVDPRLDGEMRTMYRARKLRATDSKGRRSASASKPLESPLFKPP